jgi:membrane protease subunit HflK
MSWQDRGGPWGRDHRPPEIDELFEKIRNLFRSDKAPTTKFPVTGVIILIVALLWSATGIYKVVQDEVGVVQRFGKFNRAEGPGLHWKFPSGIEKVTKVKVQFTFQEEFGVRTLLAGIKTEYAPEKQYEPESLMLTGDLNCVLVPWVVQFRVADAQKFLFKVRNVRDTLRDLAEAAMRRVVGDRSLDEVLNTRQEIATAAQKYLQETLEEVDSGLVITTVELGKTNVPEPVQPSFNEVNAAIQEKEQLIYQAQGAYNKVIPEARGNAEKTVSEAEGYALERIQKARGDAARFIPLYEEYSKSREVTRRRLYLEAMKELFPKLGDKYILDAGLKGFVPLLNVGEKGGKP